MNKFFALLFVMAIAQYSLAQGIANSAHDFSSKTWNGGGEICIVCHTPHNGDLTVLEAPLWNHELSAVASYTVYGAGSATLDATVGQPAASSKLCLSCHDGTVALENFGGATGGTNYVVAGLLGTDLSNDHPISFTYDAILASTDGELFNPTNTTSGLGGNIDADMLFGASNNQVECASCHDVHDAAGAGAGGYLLVKPNTGSALCLTCHNK